MANRDLQVRPQPANFKDCVIGNLFANPEYNTNSQQNNAFSINNRIPRELLEGKHKESGKDEDDDDDSPATANQVQLTRIEKILQMQEESSKCCETECDYGTCGILRAQYHLGPGVSFLPILINYYDALIKTEHEGELVESVYDQIAAILITKIKVSVEECNLYAGKNYQQKNYFQAILFHLIAGQLLPTTKDVSRVLHGVQAFTLGIKLCIMKIAQECSFYNNIVRLRILPKMRIFLRSVFDSVIGRSKKDLVMVEVQCMHHLEVSEGFVGDYDASEATLIASLDRLENVLREGAKIVHLYGTVLNNLGATYLRKKKPDQAIDRLAQAIEVNMNATDYNSEEERKEDVQRSERVLNQAENMKKRMAGNG